MAKKLIAQYRNKVETTKVLNIYENSKGLRGSVIENGRVSMSAMFYEKDRDNTEFRVMEYFGFTLNNSYKAK